MRRSRDPSNTFGGSQKQALSDHLSRIFSERASFELRDEDVEAIRKQLKGSMLGLSQQVSHLQSEDMLAWKAKHPCLLENATTFFENAKGKRISVFLDYDGTLTPIVKNPDRAFMSDQMRDAVRSVARLFPTAIISGRGREKVAGFVKLQELFYAGSHGMDIVGPSTSVSGGSGEQLAFQPAAKFEPVMDEVFANLIERTKDIPGSSVEHNKFCVSVHFRNCEADRWDDVVAAVEAELVLHPDLRATRGRKVLEIRPQVDWDKGRALAHLLTALELDDSSDVVPIYIGDDRTDEDAFAVLNQRPNGVGILVSTKVKPTEAVYTLRDPVEVMSFLSDLVAWGRTEHNGWHQKQSCCGWHLNLDTDSLLVDPSTPPRGDFSGISSELSDTGDEEIPPAQMRRSGGRPPLCPPDRSRLSQASLTNGLRTPDRQISIDSQASTSVAGSSDVKLSNSNGMHGVIANGGPAPDSPFEKVTGWNTEPVAPMSSPQVDPELYGSGTAPDNLSGSGLEGGPSRHALDQMIHSVADSVRAASSGDITPATGCDATTSEAGRESNGHGHLSAN